MTPGKKRDLSELIKKTFEVDEGFTISSPGGEWHAIARTLRKERVGKKTDS